MSAIFFVRTTDANGAELWVTDGTPGGAHLVKDINSGTASSAPFNLFNANGSLFFDANDGIHGPELWISNGTSAGTTLLKDINPATTAFTDSAARNFTALNSTIFFIANDGTHGLELFKPDGTPAGTVMVADIKP